MITPAVYRMARSRGFHWVGFLLLLPGLLVGQVEVKGQTENQDVIRSLRAKADGGDAQAQTDLGLRYIEGAGVPKDLGQAATWLKKAALQGFAPGQLELGVMYVNGEGVTEDLREGYAWYLLSSQQGNAQAKEYLADLDRSISGADREKARVRATELAKLIDAERRPKQRHGSIGAATGNEGTSKARRPESGEAPKVVAPSGKPAPTAKGGQAAVEGKDYTIWQRVRILDQNGFGQPVEAYSILLPKGWRTEGAVRWVINAKCPADAVQNRLSAVSADGAFRLEVFPQHNWQWYDDPMLLQNAQQSAQFSGGGCPLGRPFNAGEYLEQVFMSGDLRGAQLVGHHPNEQLAGVMRQQADQANSVYRAAGVRLESRPSAEVGQLRWPDGRVGIVLCAVEQTVGFMPNVLNGGTYASYQCRVTVKTFLSAPAGQAEEAERLLGTIVASTRVNPEWQSAVQGVYNNIAKVEQQETAKRAAIWRQTQSEISDIQRRTWENSQASRDRINEAWGQTLRGVESWKEPGGGSIELSSGYNEAWSKGDGTYILSNNPLFDPNVAFQENWTRLDKKQ